MISDSTWLADDYSYNIVETPVHIRDLHATILHCLGMDYNRFVPPPQTILVSRNF